MQILYGAKGAGSVAPQALLTHLEVPFELKLISFDANEHQSEAFLAVNPRGQIPVLVLDDKSVLTESLAIMLHVADSHLSSALIPAPGSAERAQVYRWMSFTATNVYEGLLRLLYPDMYTTNSDLSKVVESADQYLNSAFGILNQALSKGPWLVGGRTGVTDIYLAMLLTWYPDQQRLYEVYTNLQPSLKQTLALEGVTRVFEENELI
ncbi:MAG: glutathione S-transferase family protein [Gammaproteobacteria bacterium]|nr:glutathione S-transferase family protein [Gammaproteobacteria bacterium]MDH3464662.1 glutathione S-transferase family protein [Gammaproteobacteria bacterium]